MSDDAFFRPDGDGFVATPHTRGPWSDDHAHGGPPAALVVRALERLLPHGALITRVAIDLLRPVPLGARLTVAAEVVRGGRSVTLLAATLRAGDKELTRTQAVALRTTTLSLPPLEPPGPLLPAPAGCEPFEFPFFKHPVGYHTAMECRAARGRFGVGRFAVWMRARVALVPGEPWSPLGRVVLAADAQSGVSLALDTKRFSFVNPDFTLHLHRPLEGEWAGIDATTTPWPHGTGLAESLVHDPRGPVGRAAQSLLIDPVK